MRSPRLAPCLLALVAACGASAAPPTLPPVLAPAIERSAELHAITRPAWLRVLPLADRRLAVVQEPRAIVLVTLPEQVERFRHELPTSGGFVALSGDRAQVAWLVDEGASLHLRVLSLPDGVVRDDRLLDPPPRGDGARPHPEPARAFLADPSGAGWLVESPSGTYAILASGRALVRVPPVPLPEPEPARIRIDLQGLHDATLGRTLPMPGCARAPVLDLAPDGSQVAYQCSEERPGPRPLHVVALAEGTLRASRSLPPLESIAILDPDHLLVRTLGGRHLIVELEGAITYLPSWIEAETIALSPNERRVLVTSRHGTMQVIDRASGTTLCRTEELPFRAVRGAGFVDDATLRVIGTYDADERARIARVAIDGCRMGEARDVPLVPRHPLAHALPGGEGFLLYASAANGSHGYFLVRESAPDAPVALGGEIAIPPMAARQGGWVTIGASAWSAAIRIGASDVHRVPRAGPALVPLAICGETLVARRYESLRFGRYALPTMEPRAELALAGEPGDCVGETLVLRAPRGLELFPGADGRQRIHLRTQPELEITALRMLGDGRSAIVAGEGRLGWVAW